MRQTESQTLVAARFLARPRARHYGYDLARDAGVRSGVLYPMLHRWLAAGWLTDGWEEPRPVGRPPRRYYRLTAEGKKALS